MVEVRTDFPSWIKRCLRCSYFIVFKKHLFSGTTSSFSRWWFQQIWHVLSRSLGKGSDNTFFKPRCHPNPPFKDPKYYKSYSHRVWNDMKSASKSTDCSIHFNLSAVTKTPVVICYMQGMVLPRYIGILVGRHKDFKQTNQWKQGMTWGLWTLQPYTTRPPPRSSRYTPVN